MNPDYTQACWELGSAVLGLLNVRAIRKSKSIAGVHWVPTAFFAGWGVYNLWFYDAMSLPTAWWAGIAITCTNAIWLGHVAWYWNRKRQINKVMDGLVKLSRGQLNAMAWVGQLPKIEQTPAKLPPSRHGGPRR